MIKECILGCAIVCQLLQIWLYILVPNMNSLLVLTSNMDRASKTDDLTCFWIFKTMLAHPCCTFYNKAAINLLTLTILQSFNWFLGVHQYWSLCRAPEIDYTPFWSILGAIPWIAFHWEHLGLLDEESGYGWYYVSTNAIVWLDFLSLLPIERMIFTGLWRGVVGLALDQDKHDAWRAKS